jgi:hypothetical protein
LFEKTIPVAIFGSAASGTCHIGSNRGPAKFFGRPQHVSN